MWDFRDLYFTFPAACFRTEEANLALVIKFDGFQKVVRFLNLVALYSDANRSSYSRGYDSCIVRLF